MHSVGARTHSILGNYDGDSSDLSDVIGSMLRYGRQVRASNSIVVSGTDVGLSTSSLLSYLTLKLLFFLPVNQF